MKNFSEMQNVGMAKYVVNYHDGEKKHKDGSPFYDIKILENPSVSVFNRQWGISRTTRLVWSDSRESN